MENFQTPAKVSTAIRLARVLLILFVLIGLSGAIFFYVKNAISTLDNKDEYMPNEGLNGKPSEITKGLLFASGRSVVGTSSRDTIFGFDLDSPQGEVADLADPLVRTPKNINFLDKFSLSSYLIVASTPNSYELSQNIDSLYLHEFELSSGGRDEVKRVFSAIQGNTMSGIAVATDKRTIAFSRLKDERIDNSSKEARDLQNFETVLVDYESGEAVAILDKAAWPAWVHDSESDNTSLLILRNDGIYVYDIITGDEKPFIVASPIQNSQINLGTQTTFKVTPDNRYLVIASPYMNRIEVFTIDSISRAESHSIGRITTDNTRYYTPVISPDGLTYAVLAVDEDGSNARVEIRAITNRTVIRTLVLPKTIMIETFSLNDWVFPAQQ